jgi:hypothetical protein
MGIKGTVRRSTDGHLIHANVDTDIIISEEPPYGRTSILRTCTTLSFKFPRPTVTRRKLCPACGLRWISTDLEHRRF